MSVWPSGFRWRLDFIFRSSLPLTYGKWMRSKCRLGFRYRENCATIRFGYYAMDQKGWSPSERNPLVHQRASTWIRQSYGEARSLPPCGEARCRPHKTRFWWYRNHKLVPIPFSTCQKLEDVEQSYRIITPLKGFAHTGTLLPPDLESTLLSARYYGCVRRKMRVWFQTWKVQISR